MMKISSDKVGTILIVDDEPQNIQVVGTMLAAFGYDFMVANDGEQALERVRARLPDLVLLDILMPKLDGFQVCREFQEIEGMEEVPVIFLSASDDKNSIVKALESGGFDYVTKPFNKAELLARVRTHLELKFMRDECSELLSNTERFLEIMAHDLKNWIGSASFSAQLLGEMEGLPDKAAKIVGTIDESTGQAIHFIDDFLANARESKTEIKFDLQKVSLNQLIAELVKQHDQRARAKRISLKVTLTDEERMIETDRTALRRVLGNLISNAIKFSPAGSQVNILMENTKTTTLRVSDEGPGFSDADMEELFTPYRRLSARPTGDEVSTGLGLSIVKKLCDRLGVTIKVRQAEPGAEWLLTFGE
ncbi:MAG: hybrid sensor histidine kinase/response regulator [Verrucomicrobiales bacterium]|nr:hybrid sensor histidine kinase/response regulator [Verrucomicrobiales bacterium]